MQYELVWLMRKINNVFLVSQTYSRQCPPLLICMHNLVIVLYVTTMTTSNAFGGNTKRKHYNMAKTNNAKCILFVGSSTTASLILTWNERSFSIEKNIWHFLMRFLGGIFRNFGEKKIARQFPKLGERRRVNPHVENKFIRICGYRLPIETWNIIKHQYHTIWQNVLSSYGCLLFFGCSNANENPEGTSGHWCLYIFPSSLNEYRFNVEFKSPSIHAN